MAGLKQAPRANVKFLVIVYHREWTVRVIEWCKTIHSVEFALVLDGSVSWCALESVHLNTFETHYLESLIEQYWKDLKDFASAMRHCQCENPSLSKMLSDILPKWAGIKMPTLVMPVFWFPALVLQWAWRQFSVSITCGEPACSGMFQRWHCKHDQHLCDTAISVGQI